MRRTEEVRELPLIDAITTISHSAHAWRDRVSTRFRAARYRAASTAKHKKEACYSLKERGITAAHKQGLLCYIGQSPQGMAVYSHGDHTKMCFNSCLHPAGVERLQVEGHPEILVVNARRLRNRICDAVFTLEWLPLPPEDYERSGAPRIARPPIICWECGEEGHIPRDCPERFTRYEDEYQDYTD